MSERGSFVTEYIYCAHCLEAAREVLLRREKFLCSTEIPSWEGADPATYLPIIAGKVGGLYAGEELNTFEFDLCDELATRICHPLRIAVLAEQGEEIFTVMPDHPAPSMPTS